ncbi:putative membrane protein [Vibrio sp. JCM 19052]|nr:putative membrane protein [Vibrio sp. JCM 19052]
MKTIKQSVDVVVAGGGTAGHIAAIQAARAGVSVSLIEASSMLGGTMTDGGVFMPNHWHSPTETVVQGIGWELFSRSKEIEGLRIKPPQSDMVSIHRLTTAISTYLSMRLLRSKQPLKPV